MPKKNPLLSIDRARPTMYMEPSQLDDVRQYLSAANAEVLEALAQEDQEDQEGDEPARQLSVLPDDFQSDEDFWDEDTWEARYRPYEVHDGTLFIPVKGYLSADWAVQLGSWYTGYGYIERAIKRAGDDDDVQNIVLLVSSGGGGVRGCASCAEVIAESEKPITAFVESYAFSAAYYLASQANEIILSPDAMTGSVGVLIVHANFQGYWKKQGVEITYVTAGEHKADGNSDEPLSEHARARYEKWLNEDWDRFIAAVAKGRGLTEDAVRATQADIFSTDDSLSNGFADRLSTLADILGSTHHEAQEEVTMSVKTTTPAPKAKTSSPEPTAEDAVKAATARIQAILDCPQAEGREDLARRIAFDTDSSPEVAVTLLEAAPKAPTDQPAPTPPQQEESPGQNPGMSEVLFNRAMEETPNPNVPPQPSGEGPSTETTESDLVANGMASAFPEGEKSIGHFDV